LRAIGMDDSDVISIGHLRVLWGKLKLVWLAYEGPNWNLLASERAQSQKHSEDREVWVMYGQNKSNGQLRSL